MKQIRVQVDKNSYDRLKKASKEMRMSFELYCGLILSGYKIIPPEKGA